MSCGRAPAASSLGLLLLLLPDAATSQERVPPADTLADAGAHHLMLAPTARTHPEGTRTAGLFAYLIPFAEYAVTDDLQVGGAMPLPPLFERGLLVLLTSKLRVLDGAQVDAAIGTISAFGVSLASGDGHGFEPGALYAVATWDRRVLSFTGGVAAPLAFPPTPLIAFAGVEAALARPSAASDDGIKLLVEAFRDPIGRAYEAVAGSTGTATIRFHDPDTAFDVGLLWRWESGEVGVAPLPVIGVTFTF